MSAEAKAEIDRHEFVGCDCLQCSSTYGVKYCKVCGLHPLDKGFLEIHTAGWSKA